MAIRGGGSLCDVNAVYGIQVATTGVCSSPPCPPIYVPLIDTSSYSKTIHNNIGGVYYWSTIDGHLATDFNITSCSYYSLQWPSHK